MIQVIFTMGQNQSRGNSKISVKPGETNPLAKTLAFTYESTTLCQIMNMFRWEEEIPNVQSQGYVLVDRLFDVKIFSKAIRFSASYTYDNSDSSVTLKVKIVEGGELLTGNVIINLKYSCDGITGHFRSGVSFFMFFYLFFLASILQKSKRIFFRISAQASKTGQIKQNVIYYIKYYIV